MLHSPTPASTRARRVIASELPPEDAGRVYFFNSFFAKKLTEKERRPAPVGGGGGGSGSGKGGGPTAAEARARRSHERVKKWTKVGPLEAGARLNSSANRSLAPVNPVCPRPSGPSLPPATMCLTVLHCLVQPLAIQSTPAPTPQDVDIFSKDFLFIPLHDALHWSLLVVCFPGELGAAFEAHSGGGDAGGGGGGDAAEEGALLERRPCMLHLDSMPGGWRWGAGAGGCCWRVRVP
jgi:hypothetical protein